MLQPVVQWTLAEQKERDAAIRANADPARAGKLAEEKRFAVSTPFVRISIAGVTDSLWSGDDLVAVSCCVCVCFTGTVALAHVTRLQRRSPVSLSLLDCVVIAAY